jgi:hypothetical protein
MSGRSAATKRKRGLSAADQSYRRWDASFEKVSEAEPPATIDPHTFGAGNPSDGPLS